MNRHASNRIALLLALMLLLLPCAALADGQAAAQDELLTVPSAANAAKLLRQGDDGASLSYWDTAQGHATQTRRLKKATVTMLQNALGLGQVPVGRDGIRFCPCQEVPMLQNGEKLQKRLDYNLHGSIYTDSPLTSVTARFVSRGGQEGETQTVTFLPEANVCAYSLCSSFEPVEKNALDTLFDVSDLAEGRYSFSLEATTVNSGSPVVLVTVDECTIEKTDRLVLTRNKFDDNYMEANRFFGGDTDKFIFHYSIKDTRSIATENDWREAYLVESSLGRVHKDALPYFEKANEYLINTYVSVTLQNPNNGNITKGRVTLLKKLMQKCSTYVPRFQSNMEYLSHHTLGTAADVNDNMYPNFNIITNHDVIGNDVRDCLTYNGLKTSDRGIVYYDFTYTGAYPAKYERVPKSIINYLLYELAFYRAGFQWGFYYETACDAMHFMLSENDYNLHMHSDVGLRKITAYLEDGAPVEPYTPPVKD